MATNATLILPPKNIVGLINSGSVSVNSTYSNSSSVWNGSAFSFNAIITITPQYNSSEDTTPTPYEWNGYDVVVGMWVGQFNGATYKITSIIFFPPSIYFGRYLLSYLPDSFVMKKYPYFSELYKKFRKNNKINNGGDIHRLNSFILNIEYLLLKHQH